MKSESNPTFRTQVLTTRVTSEQLEAVREAAAAAGAPTLSEWVRDALDAAASSA